LVAGFAAVSKADVTGSFDIHIALSPEGTQTEAVKFEIDLQSNLNVNITLSGLTFGADLGFGTTGVEFAVLSLTTNLGALSVFDQFVFATPFGCALEAEGNGSNTAEWSGQCPGTYVEPVGDVAFVKKRISLELNIAGITLTNLAIFEDVDFPDIQGGGNHEHDHFAPGDIYYTTDVNSTVDDNTPTYGFGDVISISGQTVSGITVSGSTTFCASKRNYIKKRNWAYEVNKACTASFGNLVDPIEGGAKTPILFEEETLSLSGIEIGGVSFDIDTVWTPGGGIETDVSASFSVLDLAFVVVTLSSDNLTSLNLSEIDVFVSSGNLSLIAVDFGGDLNFDLTILTFSVVLNPNQNPADLVVTLITAAGYGLVELDMSLGITRGPLSLDTTTTFEGAGYLEWTGTSFDLSVDSGGGLDFGASFFYGPDGMGTISINLGVLF
jgi:hypothetical protein